MIAPGTLLAVDHVPSPTRALFSCDADGAVGGFLCDVPGGSMALALTGVVAPSPSSPHMVLVLVAGRLGWTWDGHLHEVDP